MSSVFLVSPGAGKRPVDHLLEDYRLLVRSAKCSSGIHTLADSPTLADVVLFVGSRDPLHRDVRSHELTRRFPKRVVLYDSRDWLTPYLRGIYPSIQANRYRARRMRSGHYLRWSDRTSIRFTDPDATPTNLFSFRGAVVTHPVRRRVMALQHPKGLLTDTTLEPGRGFGQSDETYVEYRNRYGEELASVRFVLCPRGAGPSSMRIFEAMKAGRVPVVISDQWVEPAGPEWSTFSLRVAERQVASIPQLLETVSHRAGAMGRRARREWEAWFSPESSFSTLSALAVDLVAGGWFRENVDRLLARRYLIDRTALLHLLGPASLLRVLRVRSNR